MVPPLVTQRATKLQRCFCLRSQSSTEMQADNNVNRNPDRRGTKPPGWTGENLRRYTNDNRQACQNQLNSQADDETGRITDRKGVPSAVSPTPHPAPENC
ncbi:unnamed protein product [Pleuronectes platessa]|uniref:Uncharacterized protein n=1 Tax=Pleuronectes platessa TaxID=8262 RepID=A0A9N7W1E7_PLEPL|nr:unnamed protein product [Pleuronectes platessa]